MPGFDLELLLGPDDELSSPEKRRALAASLRKQQQLGTVGQLMGVEPTVRAGAALQERAGDTLRMALQRQQQARAATERATDRTQQQSNADRTFTQQQAQEAERTRQFNAQEARLRSTQGTESKRQWQAAVDPITGQMRLYNVFTGQWADEAAGGGAPPPGGAQQPLPQFNPQMGMRPTEKMKNDITSIQQQRGAITGALGGVEENPKAFGVGVGTLLDQFGGSVGSALANWARDPKDTNSRAFVLNNVSAIINERAGAAQSVQELARLRGFLPSDLDDAAHVKAKFEAFLEFLDEREAATRGFTVEQIRAGRVNAPPQPGATTAQPGAAGAQRNFEAEYGVPQ